MERPGVRMACRASRLRRRGIVAPYTAPTILHGRIAPTVPILFGNSVRVCVKTDSVEPSPCNLRNSGQSSVKCESKREHELEGRDHNDQRARVFPWLAIARHFSTCRSLLYQYRYRSRYRCRYRSVTSGEIVTTTRHLS
jgi:hypothetical protein